MLVTLPRSLPGAVGMFGLCVGISNIGSTLPRAVYALLSGLNAATVGIIARAAVELSSRTLTDKLTKTLVSLTGAAGLLYKALWYFPVLIFAAGLAAVTHDYRWLHRLVHAIKNIFIPARASSMRVDDNEIESGSRSDPSSSFTTFFLAFIVVMVLRGVLHNPPILYKILTNLCLAGTIVFGGGPVVIPLLREHVVAEGWVSPRDFLVGLAIIQAFPGPNFNFAFFLGGLTCINDKAIIPVTWLNSMRSISPPKAFSCRQ